MKCRNCGKNAFHTKTWYEDGLLREVCNNCRNIGSGPKIDGILTRNSFRMRRQQEKNEADFVMPHRYNKVSRKLDINPDFVKLYPDKVKEFFTSDQIKREGMSKLAQAVARQVINIKDYKEKAMRDVVQYKGDSKKHLEKAIKSLPYARPTAKSKSRTPVKI